MINKINYIMIACSGLIFISDSVMSENSKREDYSQEINIEQPIPQKELKTDKVKITQPPDFIPSEKIKSDSFVSFPVDI